MSVFAPTKKREQSKVPNSQYIRTENKPEEAVPKPAEPVKPAQPEVK